ncbi:haloacid dehalogenase [Skermanella aerolata]|uniref:Haloacid dehalogenase n=1 Tax=Skermanella aerolata TaxID=393310 RepID=A0A512DWI0_9PROT|nr:HAD family hydrolase [Skermanella aerolata]KJB95543.1 HAD hydrolase [Skermanella aerolata KACC 11604]GEO40827.1 haloacid dehalogenase [Skermanella aerolata]
MTSENKASDNRAGETKAGENKTGGWTIGFDGDDTLWHNESIFSMTQDKFRAMLGEDLAADGDRRLLDTERGNLGLFGYGIKGFILSMIETAIEVTDGRIEARDIQAMIEAGKAMLRHPVELLDGVAETVEYLSHSHRLVLVTKGDLFDQESKIARSGLAEMFDAIEIVSEKDPATYRRVLTRHGIAPERFLMVGNSVRSDILPVLEIGGRAVHVPYHITWAHEHVEPPEQGYERIDAMAELTGIVHGLGH